MLCPNDGSELKMSERQGVEVDYCPQCRGVWLDRGELDKILDRAASESARLSTGAPQQETPLRQDAPPYPAERAEYGRGDFGRFEPRERRDYDDDDYRKREYNGDYERYGRKRKREGFLSEIFDFD